MKSPHEFITDAEWSAMDEKTKVMQQSPKAQSLTFLDDVRKQVVPEIHAGLLRKREGGACSTRERSYRYSLVLTGRSPFITVGL